MDKDLFLQQLQYLVQDETDIIANLSNASAFLNSAFDDINWLGFYLLKENELVLGPFQGNVACVRIPLGHGVCGTAAQKRQVLRVEDVHQFAGHIACDANSNSEIVLPIIVDECVVGVLDIDSPSFNRFTQKDEDLLKDVVKVIETFIFK